MDEQQYEKTKETIFNDWLSTTHDESTIIVYDNWEQLVPLEPRSLQTE